MSSNNLSENSDITANINDANNSAAVTTHGAGIDVKYQRLLTTTFTEFSAKRLSLHLTKVYEFLHNLEQTSTVPPVSTLIAQLMHKRVFDHRKPEVRTLVAAVFAEILRLTIEKPQFDKMGIIKIFSLFERVLIGLRDLNAPNYEFGFTVIQEVVMSQCVALLIEACCSNEMQQDDENEDEYDKTFIIVEEELEPLQSFMKSVVNVMTDQHQHQFYQLMLELAIFVLEELDHAGGVPQSIMDVVLTELIVELRDSNEHGIISQICVIDESGTLAKQSGPPRSYNFAQDIIIESASFMATDLVRFINSVLNGKFCGLFCKGNKYILNQYFKDN